MHAATHPNPEAIRAMTAAVRGLEERRPLRLNFQQSRVFEHGCRTVACLAGHFCLATCGDRVRFDHGVACHAGSGQPVEFLETGNFLAHRLGMASMDALENWAAANPDLWGNRRGAGLLRDPRAYPKPPEGTPQGGIDPILDHWDAVAGRIDARLAQDAALAATA